MSSLGKTDFLIQMQTKTCIYLMKQLRTFSLTLYRTRLSFVMVAIPYGLIAKLKIRSRKKIFLRSAIFKITMIFNYFKDFGTFRISELSQLKNQNNSFILETRIG